MSPAEDVRTETPRVGLMIPSSNTMMEADFQRHLGGRTSIHTARMFMTDATVDAEITMLDVHAIPAARDLSTAKPHVVVFGCTSAGALRGSAYDEALCARIEAIAGVETISTIGSVRRAITSSGATRIGIVTPYVDELNERIRASVEADGIEVVSITGLGMTDNPSIARVSTTEIVEFAARSIDPSLVDLAFISCTNFAAVSARSGVEARLGLPVITSNQAVLDATAHHIVVVREPFEATRDERD